MKAKNHENLCKHLSLSNEVEVAGECLREPATFGYALAMQHLEPT